MRQKIFFALVCIVCTVSCDQAPIPEVKENPTEYTVRFKMKQQIEVEPFSLTKSIPDNLPKEPVAASSSGNGDENNPESPDLPYKYIEYAVYSIETDELIRHINFSGDDEDNDDFGVYLYDNFKAGTYKVCFLAHSSPGLSLVNNQFTFDQINDTFYASEEIEIDINSEEEPIEIVLKRIVSRVEFLATDPVPDKVKSFNVNLSNRYNVFDLFSGKIQNTSSVHSFTHVFTAEERETGKRNKHAFFTFVPEEANNAISKVILTALDQDDNEVRKRAIENIPVFQNKITRYTGILYTPGLLDGTFNLVIENDGAWSGTDEFTLPE